jgi:hypothetical protein
VRLNDLAKRIYLRPQTLRAYNPQILRGITPPGSGYELWVPSQLARRVASLSWNSRSLASISKPVHAHGRPRVRIARNRKSHPRHYRVKPGDNLSLLARKFKVPVHRIKKANRMRHDRLYAGQSLRIPDWSGGT